MLPFLVVMRDLSFTPQFGVWCSESSIFSLLALFVISFIFLLGGDLCENDRFGDFIKKEFNWVFFFV